MKFTFYYSAAHQRQMYSVNLYAPGKVTTRPYFRGRLYTDAMAKGRPAWRDAVLIGTGDLKEVIVK